MPLKVKIIDIKTKEEIFPDKVPLEELRRIWSDKETQYTDEQLEQIRTWLSGRLCNDQSAIALGC